MIVEQTYLYFNTNNPILKYQAVAVEEDTRKVKYGDGQTAYNSIDYSGFLMINNSLVVDTTADSPFNEIALVSGAIDGVNNIFVWASVPSVVILNGQILREGTGYTLVGTTTTLTNIPFVGDLLWAYGTVAGAGEFQEIPLTSGAINGINLIFVWDEIPLLVFWNGQKLEADGVGYTLVGTTTTFVNPPFTGDSVEAYGNY